LNIPAVWIGLYAAGLGGEVIFWHPGIRACYRCLCARRYEAHQQAETSGASLDPTSHGATIFDVHLIDAIAGQIAIGLLTAGSDTRFGRLIDELGDRNFIQVQLDPHFQIGGREVIREMLSVPADKTRSSRGTQSSVAIPMAVKSFVGTASGIVAPFLPKLTAP
jgi:hypothetical protein